MRRPPRTDGTAPLGAPILIVNLKSYPSATGPAAERLAASLHRLATRAGVAAAVAPAPADIGAVAAAVDLPVLAQHLDPLPPGARTGFVVPEALRAAGAVGSLVNHSEHPLAEPAVARTVARAREAGLVAVVCARDSRQAARLARIRPPYLAVEPPELIGGRVSVATARPELVSDSVDAVRRRAPSTRVLCGAGVHDRNDVRIALDLGAEGVLVASAVATARRPERAIAELLAGFP